MDSAALVQLTRNPFAPGIPILLTAALVAVCGDDEPDPCREVSRPVELSVVDSLGNPLNIDTASAVRGERRIACKTAGMPYAKATCMIDDAGAWTLEYFVAGVAQSFELESLTDVQCKYLYTTRLSLVYDGPGCDYAALTAVEGRLVNEQGEVPSNGKVTASAEGESAECTVEAGNFTCPALTPLSAEYTVVAEFTATAFSQKVQVAFSDCGIAAPARLDFDLGPWVCEGEPEPAGRVYVHTRDPGTGERRDALADRVTVHSRLTEPEECALEEAPSIPGPRAYICPTTTRFGSGTYTFEATRDGVMVSKEQVVSSFDCRAGTALIDLDFAD